MAYVQIETQKFHIEKNPQEYEIFSTFQTSPKGSNGFSIKVKGLTNDHLTPL